VRATRSGSARHRRTKRTARTVYESLLADWSEEDLTTLVELLRRYNLALEEHPPERAFH